MSLDQNVTPAPAPSPAAPAVSAIENEIATYRAISPHAVAAVIAGVVAAFSFANLSFLIFAALAVVLGFYAERKIQRYSDVLTGRGFAQTGIALGMVFGLGTITIQTVQSQIRKAEATAFAKQFVDVLKKGSVDEAIWYRQPPAFRRGKSVTEVKEEVMKSMRDPHMFDMQFGGLKTINERAHTAGENLRFVRIEESGSLDLSNYAAVLLELTGPGTEKHPNKQEYALLLVKSAQNEKNGRNEWWVDHVTYPYTLNTFTAPSKPVDDGHGHAH